MPAIVDHEERREMVASIASELVAERGPEAVTVRDIAARAGVSTAIVSHYFQNKRELLLFMYRSAADRSAARYEAALKANSPALDCLETLLPMDRERRTEWLVWLAFWGKATTDTAFQAEQKKRVENGLRLIEETLQRTEITAARRPSARQHILTTIMGLAVQASFDPDAWPADAQRTTLSDLLEGLGL